MESKIAVIIPCFNQGHFLADALASLSLCDKKLFEIIIVDDGSSDPFTINYFSELEKQNIRVIHQVNKGLSAARNTGIFSTGAEYVILLDADNKIRPEFLTTAISVLDNDVRIAVMYGDGMYFGDKMGLRKQYPFNLQKQMLVNYIDACAAIRRSVLIEVEGYDEKMKTGWEDWEIWLRIAFKGYHFAYVPAVLFDYRIRKGSMAKSVYENKARTNAIENYVYNKYPDKMGINYVVDFVIDRFKRNPIGFLIKLIIRACWPSYYNKLLNQNKIRNGL